MAVKISKNGLRNAFWGAIEDVAQDKDIHALNKPCWVDPERGVIDTGPFGLPDQFWDYLVRRVYQEHA